jgi:hypothetical protein
VAEVVGIAWLVESDKEVLQIPSGYDVGFSIFKPNKNSYP